MRVKGVFEDFIQFQALRGVGLLRPRLQVTRFLRFQRDQGRRPWQVDEALLIAYSQNPRYSLDAATALRTWLRYLHRKEWLAKDWSGQVVKPKFRLGKKRPVPNHGQVLNVLAGLPDDDKGLCLRAIFEMLYGSGLRSGELRALDLSDVLWAEQRLVLHKTKNRRERTVPLTRWAAHALAEYLSEVRPLWKGPQSGEALWLWSNGLRIGRHYPSRWLRKVKAGFSAHGLRHACATRLLHAGANLVQVKELLGHQCLVSTQVYTQVTLLNLKAMLKQHHPRSQR